MNTLTPHFLESIGWTLIHSTWQALVICIFAASAARLLPTRLSGARYAVGIVSLALVVISSVVTFLLLFQVAASPSDETKTIVFSWTAQAGVENPGESGIWMNVVTWIDQHLLLLIRLWIIGFVIFSVRLASGLAYITYLRKHALTVQGEWADHLNSLAAALNIRRVIRLAEGPVGSPMVIGYLKPVVLFPVGLLSGLSTEQVETVLLHELSHIRRHDYLVNLFQAVTETIFFFNPCVWMISSIVREEREHCCDDMVIAKGISPIVYVKTLAQLEASNTTLALGMAGSQNQLLNRMKRIMEKSAKKEWGTMRLLPLGLLLVGFVCASWLSVGPLPERDSPVVEAAAAPQDTTIKRFRWSEAPVPDVSQPEVPEELTEVLTGDFFGPVPEPDYVIEFPSGVEIPDAPGFEFDFDSIPGANMNRWNEGNEDWERFAEEFRTRFKEQFKDFYGRNEEKMSRLMEEMKKENFEFYDAWKIDASILDQLSRLKSELGAIAPRPAEAMAAIPAMPGMAWQFYEDAELADEMRMAEKVLRSAPDRMEQAELAMRMQAKAMRQSEQAMQDAELAVREVERVMRSYELAVLEQLVKDGYTERVGKTGEFHIRDEGQGNLTINGKKIKKEDEQKYRDLRAEYLKESRSHRPRRAE